MLLLFVLLLKMLRVTERTAGLHGRRIGVMFVSFVIFSAKNAEKDCGKHDCRLYGLRGEEYELRWRISLQSLHYGVTIDGGDVTRASRLHQMAGPRLDG